MVGARGRHPHRGDLVGIPPSGLGSFERGEKVGGPRDGTPSRYLIQRFSELRCGSVQKSDVVPHLSVARCLPAMPWSRVEVMTWEGLAGSFSKQSISRSPARPAERECSLRDIFCNRPRELSFARAGQRGVAGVAAGCWVVGGAAAGAAAGRARGSQRPFTMRIFRALHLRTAARTLAFDTQMPSTS
jgi:hypothetical protein